MLDTPVYAGFRLCEGELVKGTWKPIVGFDLWQQVQLMRKEQQRFNTPQRKRTPHLLTGLLVCGTCGANLNFHPSRRGKSGFYECRRSRDPGIFDGGTIGAARAERLVIEAYFERFRSAFLRSDDEAQRVVSLSATWESASVEERRALLSVAIEKVELVPKRLRNPHGRGEVRARSVKVVWAQGLMVAAVPHPSFPTLLPAQQPPGKRCAVCHRRKHPKEFSPNSGSAPHTSRC
jgi:hypothetical protein